MNASSHLSIISATALGAKAPLETTVKASGQLARVSIIGEIYDTWSPEDFRYSIGQLSKSGVKDIELYINSVGGSVFGANEIVNICEEFVSQSGGEIRGKGGAIVASAASFIAVHCTSFEMASNGMIMIHKPSGVVRGNADQIESSVLLLRKLEDQYAAAYATKTGMSSDEIKALYEKADYWMTAQDALSQKFIDGIAGKAVIDEGAKAVFTAAGIKVPQSAPVASSHNANPNNKNKMEIAVILALLGLDANADQKSMTDQIRLLQQKAAAYDAMQESMNSKKAEEKTKRIEAAVEKAIKDKKIHADARDYYTSQLTAAKDLDAEIAKIEALTPAKSITETTKSEKPVEGMPAERASWDFDQWQKEDPRGLEKLPEAAFNKLYNAKFKTSLPEA